MSSLLYGSIIKLCGLEEWRAASTIPSLTMWLIKSLVDYMSITVAESSCLDLPRCEEAIDEDIVLEHRVASGLTMTNMSFGLAKNGDLVTTCSSWDVSRMERWCLWFDKCLGELGKKITLHVIYTSRIWSLTVCSVMLKYLQLFLCECKPSNQRYRPASILLPSYLLLFQTSILPTNRINLC